MLQQMNVYFSDDTVIIRHATGDDVAYCKQIADANRDSLGFINSAILTDSMSQNRLLVAESCGMVVGFARYYHRIRVPETTLYDICVAEHVRRKGIGRSLIHILTMTARSCGHVAIIARCPEGISANEFYVRLHFVQDGIKSGRRRRLIQWRLFLV